MITPQESRERLKAFYDTDEAKKRILRLNRLPGNLSQIGQILIQSGPAWEKAAEELGRQRRHTDVLGQLGKLKSKDRLALFNALYPRLAPQIEATWKLFDRLPYQTSYHRRPFRIPNHNSYEAKIFWLEQFVHVTKGYGEQDVSWFASWTPHLGYSAPNFLGYLFAASIEERDKTGQDVFDILLSSANGTHPTGAMGRHVVRGLLCVSRPDGWEFMEKMVLAAQREEGLRQVIFESIDESHPQAFRRLLRVILEHNLSRFSSAMRAFDVWFGLQLETAGPKNVSQILAKVLLYLDSPDEQRKAIEAGTPEEAYFALWTIAFDNALEALPLAIELRQSKEAGLRFVATHLIAQINLEQGLKELMNALEDDDLRIVSLALASLGYASYGPFHNLDSLASTDLFERLERLLGRIPHKQITLKPLVWDWMQLSLDRNMILGQLVNCVGTRGPKRLVPYLPLMEPNHRARVASLFKEEKYKGTETMQVLLKLVGDPSPHVRETALRSMEGYSLKEEDILYLEELLSRRAEDLRRGIIQLLLGLPGAELKGSLARLLNQKSESQRLAGLELLRECRQKKLLENECQRLVREYTQRSKITEEEKRLLEDVATQEIEKVSLENALGLMDPQNRTRPEPVRTRNKSIKLISHVAIACLKSIDKIVDEHRNDAVEVNRGDRKVIELLGNLDSPWMYVSFNPRDSREDVLSRLPLRDLWDHWWHSRSGELRDEDGLELIRALALISLLDFHWTGFPRSSVAGIPVDLQKHFDLIVDLQLNYQAIVRAVLGWALWAHPVEGETDFIVHALEESVARISQAEMAACTTDYHGSQHRNIPRHKMVYLPIAHAHRELRPSSWNNEHHARLWKVIRWIDEPIPGIPRHYPGIADALYAYQAGAATRDDLLDLFLGPGLMQPYGYHFQLLRQFSGRRADPIFEIHPILREIVDTCREKILDVESRRADLPTAASAPAMSVRYVPGAQNLFRLLRALGKTNFERGYSYGQSRSAVLSHLIRCSYPLETDTLDDFAQLVRIHNISGRRLVELAVYAPQWSRFVQDAINWDQLGEAVWWVYAHTKDRQWSIDHEVRDEWAARISEYTPLSADRLMDGAVDVPWFHRMYMALGEEKWREVYQAAEYASGGAGHTRARLFADAMLGKVSSEEVIERIGKKRHQDSVRALGLIPLSEANVDQPEVLRRYEVMQEFLRTSKKFGSQRQASEKLAVSIGMENLARTAGYKDPQRLEWAMEIESVSDLAQGPVRVHVDDVTLSLMINDLGEPELGFSKKNKPLKSLPTGLKKDEGVSSLMERKQKLERQISRMRSSLEDAMCKGDIYSGAELTALLRHPMLKAMIEQLVFISDAGLGVPTKNGTALLQHGGNEIEIAATNVLRIAHPVDLMQNDEWHDWQHDCFIAERIQPFKQVFRELYVLTSTEKGDGNISRRYAGQQVNPRQAFALFGARGWVVDPSEGVQKTFHEAGISARVGFLLTAFTPAEVEGPTIEAVVFTNRGEWKPLPLESIPSRIFSEVMRDVDLVVSVAHAGGIDPEASASSIEARSALIRETCTLLNIDNVQMVNSHAIVNGRIGNYNVHLGSGVVHKQPGGALCIIPVHSQQRGRLFLPFVDNDPKTAEIVSKVLLLARDDQIKDPTILEQILSA